MIDHDDEYRKLARLAEEREAAWRARNSHPAMFSHPSYTIQALIVFTGLFGVLAWEGVKWVMG